jgi:NAD(P)-dependent dehydrogenase (short-subunit alcohol dehydrogenase family)
MYNRGGGRIVHIVSAAHAGGEAGTALFAAAQAAALAFTRTLAAEWDAAGVAVRALVVEATEAAAGPHAHPELRAAVRDLVTAPRNAEAMTVLGR